MADQEAQIAAALLGHEARNRSLLDRIRELGASLDAPRTIDLFFWAPSQEAAGLLVERLLERGFAELAATPPGDADDTWAVQGRLWESATRVGGSDLTEDLVRLAAALGAEYDGWGTSLGDAGESRQERDA